MELLVVIAIVGILIALLLPAIQQARETARRVHCANNLRQLAVALQNYESANNRLPPAGTYADPEEAIYLPTPGGVIHHWRIDLRSGTNYSWVVQQLPYMEEDALFQLFDMTVPVTRNQTNAQLHQPASLLCPSGEARGRLYDAVDPYSGGIVRFGKANYAAFASPFHIDSWFYPGAISLYGLRMKQVTSGTAETLVFSEVRTRDQRNDERGAWALPWSGATLLSMDMHPANPSATDNCAPLECQIAQPLQGDQSRAKLAAYAPWRGSVGFSQPPNSALPDILYNCHEIRAAQVQRMPCAPFDDAGYMSAAPRSNHLGGVNAAFLDGHVEFLTDDVDEMLMAELVAVNDVGAGRQQATGHD